MESLMKKRRAFPFPAALILIVVSSALIFLLCWRYDNKYTVPRPQAGYGFTQIDMGWYDENPFFYIVDGWELYHGKLLTPGELQNETPDAHLFIGQYGGFDLGDADAPHSGEATYHTVLLTDSIEREYALELTDIYSAWRLWINGKLVQSVGMGDVGAPAPDSRMAIFTAANKIDIVVAVSHNRGFYSGMVYPPAFGSPERVGRVSSLRLTLHAAVCGLALFIGLLCLLTLAVRKKSGNHSAQPYGALALLCLCLTGATVWPVLQAMGNGTGYWAIFERLCYYGMFLVLAYISSQICRIPKRASLPIYIAGLIVCLSVLLRPFVPVERAGALMAYANILAGYKWLTAAWLLGVSLWALDKQARYSKALLSGVCVFATALILSKILPVYEPVIGGWFVEQAGFILTLLCAGIAWYDTARAFRESLELREQKRLADFRLEAQSKHAALQREYVTATREQLHETNNAFTMLQHYLEDGDTDKLRRYLNERVGVNGAGRSGQYTGHSLVDAIVSLQIARMEEADIYLEADLRPLPGELTISDEDLTSLLMNLLDNAIEACKRIPGPDGRWVCLTIKPDGDVLSIFCENAAEYALPGEGTSKEDKQAHGYGMTVLKRITEQNGGKFITSRGEDSFSANVTVGL